MYDLIVKNGKILDGTNNSWFRADVALSGDTVIGLGDYSKMSSKNVIDAQDSYVAPGFIDVHTHADFHPLVEPTLKNWLMQGVTTIVNGNCGDSAIPYSPSYEKLNWLDPFSRDYPINWGSMVEYHEILAANKPYLNIATLVGHGRLRNAVLGGANRRPTKVELQKMIMLLNESMAAGALGMSVGLTYAPGSFAGREELTELARVLRCWGGVFVAHMRGNTVSGIKEVCEIGRETGVSVQVSHLKHVDSGLRLIQEARRVGVDITFDSYPYNAGCTTLVGVMPCWLFADGQVNVLNLLKDPAVRRRLKDEHASRSWILPSYNWTDFVVISHPYHPEMIGGNIEDLAQSSGQHPLDYVCDLLISAELKIMIILYFGTMEEVELLQKNELQLVGSDGIQIPLETGKVHPRTYGTFGRLIVDAKRGKLSLPEAIRKMTSFPASKFQLEDRGLLAPGKKGDLVVFDLESWRDKATYEHPRCCPEGVRWVIVNGQAAVKNGEIVAVGHGQVLKNTASERLSKHV